MQTIQASANDLILQGLQQLNPASPSPATPVTPAANVDTSGMTPSQLIALGLRQDRKTPIR